MSVESSSGWGSWRSRFGRVMSRSNRVSTPAAENPPPQHSGIPTASSPLSVTDSLLDIPIECTGVREGRDEEGPRLPNVKISRTHSEPLHHSAVSQPNLCRGKSAISARSQYTDTFDVKMSFLRNLFHVSDNRLALKLFGSTRGIKQEEQRLLNCQHWIIHPCSKFR